MNKNLSLGRPIRREDILAEVKNVVPIAQDDVEDLCWCHLCTANGAAGVEPLDQSSGVFMNRKGAGGPVYLCLKHVSIRKTFVAEVVAQLKSKESGAGIYVTNP